MTSATAGKSSRIVMFLYGLAAYCAFLFTILYAMGFLGNVFVPKSIDGGSVSPMGPSILINSLLLARVAQFGE